LKQSQNILGALQEGKAVRSHLDDLFKIQRSLLPLEPTLLKMKTTLQDFETVLASCVARISIPNSVHATHVTQSKLVLSRMQTRLSIWLGSADFLTKKHAAVCQLLDKSMALQQNELMTRLTVSTVDDSGTVRVITAITLIYLPITALGVCLVELNSTSKSIR
jgi:hypothetical protein